jgi:hypothetical protein
MVDYLARPEKVSDGQDVRNIFRLNASTRGKQFPIHSPSGTFSFASLLVILLPWGGLPLSAARVVLFHAASPFDDDSHDHFHLVPDRGAQLIARLLNLRLRRALEGRGYWAFE